MRQQDIAYELAKKAHEGQTRRDGITPYFDHVRDVARIAQMRGGDDLVIAAALRMDVVDAVMHLTLNKNKTYEENIRALKNNPIARQVKIADNLSNLSDAPTDK